MLRTIIVVDPVMPNTVHTKSISPYQAAVYRLGMVRSAVKRSHQRVSSFNDLLEKFLLMDRCIEILENMDRCCISCWRPTLKEQYLDATRPVDPMQRPKRILAMFCNDDTKTSSGNGMYS